MDWYTFLEIGKSLLVTIEIFAADPDLFLAAWHDCGFWPNVQNTKL